MTRLTISASDKEGIDFDFEGENESENILRFIYFFNLPSAWSVNISDLKGVPQRDIMTPHEIVIRVPTGFEMFRMELNCSMDSAQRLCQFLNRHAVCVNKDWQTEFAL